MLTNYLKIPIRHLLKNRLYSFINVFGLAIGLCAFLLLHEYAHFERSYDMHLSNYDNIYRLTTDQVIAGEIVVRDAMSFYPAGQTLKNELPEVVNYTSTFKFEPLVVRKPNDQLRQERRVLAVDRHFLKLFDYEILHGDSSRMAEPNQLILTRSKALAYFGKVNAVNESVVIHSEFERSFNVAAIIEDVPPTTHYKFDLLLSISTIQQRLDNDSWSNYAYYTYLELTPEAQAVENKPMLSALAKKYIGEQTNLTFNLQPLKEVHLASGFTFEPEIPGSAQALRVLSIIAWVILAAAWINYVNLSTANAINRAKEIGLRKVIGSGRTQLIFQFFMEAFLINILAGLLAYVLVQVLAVGFNALAGKEVLGHLLANPRMLAYLISFTLIGTFLSGFYPAVLMSGFRTLTALKGKYKNAKGGIVLRKGLVSFQFITSLILITSTLIVLLQVRYLRTIDKGMNTAQVVGLKLPAQPVGSWKEALNRLSHFSDQIRQYPGVTSTAVTTNMPGGGSSDINTSGGVRIVGLSEFNEGTFYSMGIDENVLPLLDIRLLFGRNFRKGFASDEGGVLVNESFFDKNGVVANEKMIGQKIMFGRSDTNPQYEIIGIIKDVNRTTSKNEVEPTVYFSDWGYGGGHGYGSLMVKLDGEHIGETLNQVQQHWSQFFPNEVFNYEFLDDRFATLYEEDKRFGKLTGAFSILAIVITILGLFGLTSFMASQRSKEVGVRKVLGASVKSIIALFYRDVIILLGYAVAIGVPLVWMAMNDWLSQYSKRIDFPWWVALLSVSVLVILSFLTVLIQTHRAATMNPTIALKQE